MEYNWDQIFIKQNQATCARCHLVVTQIHLLVQNNLQLIWLTKLPLTDFDSKND
jgi:hypothetical protein